MPSARSLARIFTGRTPVKPVPKDPKLVVALEEVKKFEIDNSASGTLTGPQAAIVTALREGLTSGKISEEKMEQVQTMIVTLQRESALNAQNKSIQELEALVARSMGMLSKQYEARDRLTEGLRDDLQRVGAEVDLEANGSAVVVQAQKNGATLVTEVISDDQRAKELAEKRATEEACARKDEEITALHDEIESLQKRLADMNVAPPDAAVTEPTPAGETEREKVLRLIAEAKAKVEKAKAEKLAEKEANKGLIKSLKHEEVDPTDAEKAEATRSLPSREYDKVVDGDGNVHYKRRDTMTPQKEEPGAEETKDAAPEMSPEPEPLKDHNDNEETKDEAKAKVKKPPAEEGYVLARVKKIEGLE